MRRSLLTSRWVTRLAFGVIILFVTAQMGWWLYFQQRYIATVTRNTVAGQQHQADALNALLARDGLAEVERLLLASPHLRLDAAADRVVVDADSLDAFTAKQRATVRMFAFEGPFFVLVVLTGLFVIAHSLRLERELKRRQSNFLDAIGHEYKTPISILRLLIETLQLRALPAPKQKEYFARMSAEIDRLERTGQQVLATARLEGGGPERAPEPHDLSQLARQVVERARAGLEARGAHLRFEAPPEALAVMADLDDVTILIENLLDNAVKYTPSAVKPVTVRIAREGGWAVLSVEDRGRGIPEHERRNVLERFYRVGNELTRSATGMGLGLYLVHRTALAHGGRVRIEGVAAGGTRVGVVLPLVAAATANPTLEHTAMS